MFENHCEGSNRNQSKVVKTMPRVWLTTTNLGALSHLTQVLSFSSITVWPSIFYPLLTPQSLLDF